MKLGADAHRSPNRKTRTTYNKFKQAVYFLDRDWNMVKTAYKERGGNPIRRASALKISRVPSFLPPS